MSGFPLYVLGATNTTDNVEGLNGFKKTGYTDAYFLLAGGGQTPTANYLPTSGGNITGALTIQGNTVATQTWVSAGYQPLNSILTKFGTDLIGSAPTSTGLVRKIAGPPGNPWFVLDTNTYLTQADLAGYVTTNTPQTITGDKTFQGELRTETGQILFYDNPNATWGQIQLADNEWLFENGGYSFVRFEIGGTLTLHKTNSIGASINPQTLTAPRSYNLPNASGTIALQEWVTSQGYIKGEFLGVIDANAQTLSGIKFGYSWTNTPVGGIGSLAVETYSVDWIVQTFTSISQYNEPFVWKRVRHSGTTWSNWTQVHTGLTFNPASYVTNSSLNSTLLSYVTLNGVQDITATKTFTVSPIVPNPTLAGHAVNLQYLQGYVKFNTSFGASNGYSLMLSDDNLGGEAGLIDFYEENLIAGIYNDYYKYGSQYGDFSGLNIKFGNYPTLENKIVTIGQEVQNNDDKLQVKGNVSVRVDVNDVQLILNPIATEDPDVSGLRNAHIYLSCMSDVSLPVVPIDGQRFEIFNNNSNAIEVKKDGVSLFLIGSFTKVELVVIGGKYYMSGGISFYVYS